MNTFRILVATGGVGLIMGASAACSSGSSATGADKPAATTSATTSAGATTAAADTGAATTTAPTTTPPTVAAAGDDKNFDVCAALPATTVAQITGAPFTAVKPRTTSGILFECDYTDAGSDLLQVSITGQQGKIDYDSDISSLTTVGHPPTSVSGVGDEAFSEPNPKGNAGSIGASSFASFGALFGSTYVQIGGLTYVDAAQGTQIATLLHTKFG